MTGGVVCKVASFSNEQDDETLASYLVKRSWGLENELALNIYKNSRSGRSLRELLSMREYSKDKEFSAKLHVLMDFGRSLSKIVCFESKRSKQGWLWDELPTLRSNRILKAMEKKISRLAPTVLDSEIEIVRHKRKGGTRNKKETQIGNEDVRLPIEAVRSATLLRLKRNIPEDRTIDITKEYKIYMETKQRRFLNMIQNRRERIVFEPGEKWLKNSET